MQTLIEYDAAVARQLPPLIAERQFDSRLPSDRSAERAYRAYAWAYAQLRAVHDPRSHHVHLDEDAKRWMFEERLQTMLQLEAAYKAKEANCTRNTARRLAVRAVNRAAETSQRHLFVDGWPEPFHFIGSRFPHRPLVANNPKAEGSHRRPLHQAREWLRVQFNPSSYVHMMVIDYDAPSGVDVGEIWKLAGVAKPNIITRTPDSPKGHIAYAVRTPIPSLEAGKSAKALEYFHAIWVAYTKALHGDIGFTHQLTKNPVHILDAWDVEWLNEVPYTLKELHSFVELPKNAHRAKRELREPRVLEAHEKVGLGRNCAIFYTVAHWSYRAIRGFWGGGFDAWVAAVREQCNALNATFPEPLALSEVKRIAQSIAKWTWEHTTPESFSAAQAARGAVGGRRSGQKRLAKAQIHAEAAHALKATGMTQQAIADQLGISQGAVSLMLRRPLPDTRS